MKNLAPLGEEVVEEVALVEVGANLKKKLQVVLKNIVQVAQRTTVQVVLIVQITEVTIRTCRVLDFSSNM